MIARRIAVAPALPLLAAAVLPWGSAAAAASDAVDAQALYQENCVRCHSSEVYTRADRKVTTLAGLGKQVRQCETMLELRWFDEEVDAVTRYLNDTFYHLKP